MIPLAQPLIGEDELEAIRSVIEDGMVADGPEVRRFEREFAQFCGTDHAVATANGTVALHAALESIDIGPGDRVVTTPFSFVASANAIRLAGARPVFADIDPQTYNLDPEATKEVIDETGIDAILLVHLYGLPADMSAFSDIAGDNGIYLIEDASQAHGARFRRQPVGSFGHVATFSFYPTKNMTTGEGGMIVTDDERLAQRAASFINHGRQGGSTYDHACLGTNYRMTSIAAAMGRTQLDRLPTWISDRRSNAQRLTEGITTISGITPPVEPPNRRHAYHQYTIRCENRETVKEHLASGEVESNVYYPTPIPQLEAYQGYNPEIPHAHRASREVLSLPVHPGVGKVDISRIINAVDGKPALPT